MVEFRDTKEYKMGAASESLIVQRFMRCGHTIFPAYEHVLQEGKEKAPRLFKSDRRFISPDIMAFVRGKALWVECKAKNQPGWRKFAPKGWPRDGFPRWEHGIDYYHFTHYLDVQADTGQPVYIVTHELATPFTLECSGFPPDPEPPLSDEETFRVITINRAQSSGRRELRWPRPSQGNFGARGMGGWLWPVAAMSEWILDANAR